MRSRPALMMGMEYFCTGVGRVYLQLRMFSMTVSEKPHCSKAMMWLGGLLPVTSTEISSYLSKLMPAAMVANKDSSSSGGAGGMYNSVFLGAPEIM